jgi:hypothetical protein
MALHAQGIPSAEIARRVGIGPASVFRITRAVREASVTNLPASAARFPVDQHLAKE